MPDSPSINGEYELVLELRQNGKVYDNFERTNSVIQKFGEPPLAVLMTSDPEYEVESRIHGPATFAVIYINYVASIIPLDEPRSKFKQPRMEDSYIDVELMNIEYHGPNEAEADALLSEISNELFRQYLPKIRNEARAALSQYLPEDDYYLESVTSTGAIGIQPAYNPTPRKKKKMKKRKLVEWAPNFKSDGYNPGHSRMSTSGKGVAAHNPKKLAIGDYDTHMDDHGDPLGRKHKETAFMCDVDEDGVENDPQGSHISRVGKPEDGHTSKLGHDWPHAPKNKGGAMEQMKGDRYKDGGLLSTEDWSTDNISSLMEAEDIDVWALFESYAKSNDYVCLQDFQQLLQAAGSQVKLDESYFVGLLDKNPNYIFHEHVDATGRFYTVTESEAE
jgi:hypothetical protein